LETERIQSGSSIAYRVPDDWIIYDFKAIAPSLVEAKAAVMSLITIPYQRNWIEALQQIQLKREVAGTSRIEGAEFTDRELDVALKHNATPDELLTRSQRQAHAAVMTYRWISELPNDRTLDLELIREVHRRIVTGCDDDHCEPGALRNRDYNVTFGVPRHRGCEGGSACEGAFSRLIIAVTSDYRAHDLLIQALALHYHIAAMHPFMDGNGRSARALEALVLQRAGLTHNAFIAMSNYYYEEKDSYLRSLTAVRAGNHDLTPFLIFGLNGITLQCRRLYTEIRRQMERALFRNMMYDLFNRLETKRKRVIKDRQIAILKVLLEVDVMDWYQLFARIKDQYKGMASVHKALARDIGNLIQLGTIELNQVGEKKWEVKIRPQWPQEITESEFFEKTRKMPKGKTYPFLP
jgi:Fic family protein